ncbi:hypothetical protein P3S68_021195 [Capsicum galapagoense]
MAVDYRLTPEHPCSGTYEDSWAAFQWVISHVNGKGSDSWLNDHADFSKIVVGGECVVELHDKTIVISGVG